MEARADAQSLLMSMLCLYNSIYSTLLSNKLTLCGPHKCQQPSLMFRCLPGHSGSLWGHSWLVIDEKTLLPQQESCVWLGYVTQTNSVGLQAALSQRPFC